MYDTEEVADAPAPAAAQPETKTAPSKRKKLFAGLAAVVLVAGAGYGGWYALVGSHQIETDNAYVNADVAQVTPLVAGAVQRVEVQDTQAVRQGQVLVVLDDSDARINLAAAEAELGRAQRRVRGYLATDQNLTAQIAARKADQDHAVASIASAKADFERAKIDLDRRKSLAGTGAVSGDEVTRAQNAFLTAQAAYNAAKAAQAQADANRAAAVGSLAANTVLTDGTNLETNPEIAAARAKVDQARLDLARTVIRAPIDGVVARRNVQIGQRVAAGAQLMQVVPINAVYVDANFKEVQLRKVRIGQPVELTADLYGGAVKYHGRVAGLSAGTGAAFSLIPAQNATGNWIKVVQRLPVRIAIDPADLKANPLRVGLSMKAVVQIAR